MKILFLIDFHGQTASREFLQNSVFDRLCNGKLYTERDHYTPYFSVALSNLGMRMTTQISSRGSNPILRRHPYSSIQSQLKLEMC